MKNLESTVSSLVSNSNYLAFLKQLELGIKLDTITTQQPHANTNLVGWKGLSNVVCTDQNQQIYDVDFRHAWSREIFNQHLFDFGWTENILLFRKSFIGSNCRHKLIIYFCEAATGLDIPQKAHHVGKDFLIGEYWQTITHIYLQLDSLRESNSTFVSSLKLPLVPPEVITPLRSELQAKNYLTIDQLEPSLVTEKSEQLTEKLLLPPGKDRKGEGGLRAKGLYKQFTPEKPLISVITVVFNGERYLEQTIQSVINQPHANLEYIIIDGGSEDRTLDIIKQYEDRIDYWISESDRGIYDAMNKGNTAALGSHTWHINADDILFQTPDSKLDFTNANLAGSVLVFYPKEQVCKLREPHAINHNLELNIVQYPFYHSGFVGLRNKNSWFELGYQIIADNIVIAKKITTEPVVTTNKTLAIHRREGISAENNEAIQQELRRATANSSNLRVHGQLWKKLIYNQLRKIAKSLGLVGLKRKYF